MLRQVDGAAPHEWADLPDDALKYIFSQLQPASLRGIRLVCAAWHRTVSRFIVSLQPESFRGIPSCPFCNHSPILDLLTQVWTLCMLSRVVHHPCQDTLGAGPFQGNPTSIWSHVLGQRRWQWPGPADIKFLNVVGRGRLFLLLNFLHWACPILMLSLACCDHQIPVGPQAASCQGVTNFATHAPHAPLPMFRTVCSTQGKPNLGHLWQMW